MDDGSYVKSITIEDALETLHYIISAVDSSGNWNNTGTKDVTIIDNDSPQISNIQDNPDPQYSGSYVNITCDVIDNIAVDEVHVNITYPDASYHNFTMNEGSYYYNQTYSMIGTYHYFIWATDASGNSKKSSTYTFEITSVPDTTPPEINDNTPSSATTGDSFTFTADVTDNVAVSNVYVEYWCGTGSHTNVSMDDGSYVKSITIEDALETLHYIISAVDSSGNWNNTGTKDVTVLDNDDPSIIIIFPNGGESWQVGSSHTIQWTASDNVVVTSVDIYYSTNGGSSYPYILATGESNDGSYTWTVPNTPSSTCKVKVVAHDAAGNTGYDVSNSNFEIYTTNPILSYSPSSHNFGDMLEGQTDSTTFEIWNSGTGTLSYSLSESCSWVSISPTSGSSTGEHDTITVNIDTTGLSSGSHSCDISINSNGGSETFVIGVNIIENHTYYTITASVDPPGSGTITLNPSGGTYDEGTVVTLTAVANEGYKFDHWSGDASEISSYTITMNSDKNIVAYFIEVNPLNQPPTVSITSPTEGTTVSGTVSISGTSNDTDGTVQSVQVKIDTGSWIDATGTTSWSYSWDTTTVANGSHTIYARSYDGTNYSNISSVTVVVSNIPPNQPPTVAITSPLNGSTVSGTVTITGTASDDVSVEKVEIRIDDDSWQEATGTTSWTYSWDTTSMATGTYNIYARSYDGTNYSDLASITVGIFNNHKPTVEIIFPTDGMIVKKTFTIHGTASDEDGSETIQKVEIKIGDEDWKVVNGTTSWNYTWDSTTVDNGDYVIQAMAYDGQEYSSIDSIMVKVNNEKGGGGIPGFEMVALIVALGAAMWVKRRK